MCECNPELIQLIQNTIQYEHSSKEYQMGFTKIMSQMQQSGKILWCRNDVDLDSYHNALLKNWEWLRKNLPEYDSSKGCIFTWFNSFLSYKILNEENKRKSGENMIVHSFLDSESGEWVNPLDLISAPPETPYLQEEIEQWLEQNRETLTKCFVRNCPQANCYELFLRRLPFYNFTQWHTLAEELHSHPSTLNRHYKNKCLPLLRDWLEKEGHLPLEENPFF